MCEFSHDALGSNTCLARCGQLTLPQRSKSAFRQTVTPPVENSFLIGHPLPTKSPEPQTPACGCLPTRLPGLLREQTGAPPAYVTLRRRGPSSDEPETQVSSPGPPVHCPAVFQEDVPAEDRQCRAPRSRVSGGSRSRGRTGGGWALGVRSQCLTGQGLSLGDEELL